MYLLRFTFCDSKAIFVLQFNREICTIVIYLFGIYYERKSDPRAKSFTLWFSLKAVTNQLTDINKQADCLDTHTHHIAHFWSKRLHLITQQILWPTCMYSGRRKVCVTFGILSFF